MEITKNVDLVSEIDNGPSTRANTCPDSNLATNSATYPLGYMHYYHSWTNTYYSIYCEAVSEQHLGQSFTFGQGTAKTLSSWASTLLSWFPIATNPQSLVLTMIVFAQDKGVLSGVVSGVITALVTKTMTCDFYNQEIHGTSTSHSGKPHVVLAGTYAYVSVNGSTEIKTEGYTVRQWGNSNMGRWMMYKVFGIDESPTSWSNL